MPESLIPSTNARRAASTTTTPRWPSASRVAASTRRRGGPPARVATVPRRRPTCRARRHPIRPFSRSRRAARDFRAAGCATIQQPPAPRRPARRITQGERLQRTHRARERTGVGFDAVDSNTFRRTASRNSRCSSDTELHASKGIRGGGVDISNTCNQAEAGWKGKLTVCGSPTGSNFQGPVQSSTSSIGIWSR